MNRPIIALTAGDPAGIGPEVTMKALRDKKVYDMAIPVVIGDAASLNMTAELLAMEKTALKPIKDPARAVGEFGVIEYIDLGLLSANGWVMGEVSKEAGEAAFRYVETAVKLALEKRVSAVVTAPINKEALRLAGHRFPGHTEIFAHYCGVEDYAMMLIAGDLRVIHATTHVSMREVCEAITTPLILKTIRLAKEAIHSIGVAGTIAVAGFNPHSSENGLFGYEEERFIIPAIKAALAEGIDVEGPIPADTVFVKALAGKYAIVVAMYHDQGHIPVKLAGFKTDEKTGSFTDVGGINCTVGLQVIRTSVDHGTAFDAAGKGIASEKSMLDAIQTAAVMALKSKTP